MALLILAIFIGVPILEIALFIQIGEAIGLWPTLATVIITAMVGTWFLRLQGLGTLQRLNDNLQAGRPPVREIFDGACLLVAGVLLLTPGFFTDAVGMLLFVPPVRTVLMGFVATRIAKKGHVHFSASGFQDQGFQDQGFQKQAETGPANWSNNGNGVVDGEFRVVDEDHQSPQNNEDDPGNRLR